MNTYTPMYVKQIINKDVMDSTGNSSQHSFKTYMGKNSNKNIYIQWITEKNQQGIEKTYLERNAFELWSWRRLLRVPWTVRSNQSILKEISPEYSLEGLMLKLKPQYFGYLMQRIYSFEKNLLI